MRGFAVRRAARASIAVEMLTRPAVFFLDEPTSGLDPATAREVLRLLRRLAGAGTTIVLTTHSPTDIDLCDRIVFLASRRLPGLRGDARRGAATLRDRRPHRRLRAPRARGHPRGMGAAVHVDPDAHADARQATGAPTPAPVQSVPNPSGEPGPAGPPASGTAPPVGRPDPAQRRPPGPQPADAGGARRVAGARDRHDGRAVPLPVRSPPGPPRLPRRPRRCSGWPSPGSSSV